MNFKIKIFFIVVFILCFLYFLNLRKQNKENFTSKLECQPILGYDLRNWEPKEINDFRRDMDVSYIDEADINSKFKINSSYKDSKDLRNHKNILNYKTGNINDEEIKNYINNKDTTNIFNIIQYDFKYKYDYILCNNDEVKNDKLISKVNNKRILTPNGVVFDKYNDDILVFDIYRIRRYSYRDMKIATQFTGSNENYTNYFPILDGTAIPIKTISDLERDKLIDLLYCFEIMINNDENNIDFNRSNSNYINFLKFNDKLIDEKLQKIEAALKNDKLKGKQFTISKKDYTTKSILEELEKLKQSFKQNDNIKICVDDLNKINSNNNDKKSNSKICEFEYQKDLPSFNMGNDEGLGVEDMQYDDDSQTLIHSSFLDNRMQPFANPWNNINYEGVFSPLVEERKRRALVKSSKNLKYYDGINSKNHNRRGEIMGVKQIEDEGKLLNKSILGVFDKKSGPIAKHNFEFFKNFNEEYDKLEKSVINKIEYGYPSTSLLPDSFTPDPQISVGFYHLPDELENTGIGMELVYLEDSKDKLIFIPDINNNRIQVFKIDNSETLFYGQFGNLDYTSKRSFPTKESNFTRYERVHNTDTGKYNPLPGCQKTCDFDNMGNYIGSRAQNYKGEKCMNWSKLKEENNKHITHDLDYNDSGKSTEIEDFLNKIIPKKNALGNKCVSYSGKSGSKWDKEPVCVIDKNSTKILTKCFDSYLNKKTEAQLVNDQDTCNSWLEDYTSKFGPIDANQCHGDNSISIAGKEIKKDCIFECDSKYSYRRANIHHRQKVDKKVGSGPTNNLFRKRGHHYSLVDEFERCENGIAAEKDTKEKSFKDSEFINPHFLGVDSQACIGKKDDKDNCKTKDTRNTKGVDNCSLAYRKYLLKLIAVTNQGHKFGQLFRPKSIAYDDIDNKYYVVDCHHHCIQCFELLPSKEKIITESGEKLKFVSSDEKFNNDHVFYYDSEFRTNNALNYNNTPIYSLGLRQNLIHKENFDSFSRDGEVSDDNPESFVDSIKEGFVGGTEPESKKNKKFSKEKGFSVIDKTWGERYSDTKIRLNRWVSGVSKYSNHVFHNNKKTEVKYDDIHNNKDYFFNTDVGGTDSPGCGEFSYPSDIAITKTGCLGRETQLLMVTDTGNNRVSIFKKYDFEGEARFRFYRFLGDKDDNNDAIINNPISLCISSVNGYVYVLEANFKMHIGDGDNEYQTIKVFYPNLKQKTYFFSHKIKLLKLGGVEIDPSLLDNYGNKDILPRITKIRIDDRGILLLTDINNKRVHILKETLDDNNTSSFKLVDIDDGALNKVMIKMQYDPYKEFKSYEDRKNNIVYNSDRIRFICERQRVCAFQDSDIISSREFKTKAMPFTDDYFGKTGSKFEFFEFEDVIEEREFENCWVMRNDTGFEYIDSDKKTIIKNLPNHKIHKKYNNNGELSNYEDWLGKSLQPNSSYLYKFYLYNYHFLQLGKNDSTKKEDCQGCVHTYPVALKKKEVLAKSVLTDKENYISLDIIYPDKSKEFNPIFFTILRRIHNRTMDIVTKNINCKKQHYIQLFLPSQSKIIYQTSSMPKFGKIMVYDIEKGGTIKENITNIKTDFDYSDPKYLIFYSCIGGDKKIGGIDLPEYKEGGKRNLYDSFILGDRLETVHNQIKYNVYIDLTSASSKDTFIIFKDNNKLTSNLNFYKKKPKNNSSTDMNKLIKKSYAIIKNGKYEYPNNIIYCDKGINNNFKNKPIEMNQTYEYIVLVSNPFKINPSVNSFYYTTKPEKPYIHSVEYEENDPEKNFEILKGQDVAKVTWYYPKNRSLYWPLSFLILRKDISNKPKPIKPEFYDIDFTLTSVPMVNDKKFRIKKKTLKLKRQDDSNTSTFKRRFNLGIQRDWIITLRGDNTIDAFIGRGENKKKYDWNLTKGNEYKDMKFLDIEITLKGTQEITHITCVQTIILDDNQRDISKITASMSLNEGKKMDEKEENQKIKREVELLRERKGPNFIFRLSDDYYGFYSNTNNKKTGRKGSLYIYIKNMDENKLLSIYNEISDEMKIYSGDVGLRMDGEGRTLRSGDKEMLIDKIRHFAFILREEKKREDRMVGIKCKDLELKDIQVVSQKSEDNIQVKEIVCENTGDIKEEINNSNNNKKTKGNMDYAVMINKGLRGEGKLITKVQTLEECYRKCNGLDECTVAEYNKDSKECKIYSNYDSSMVIDDRPKSTLIAKTKETFQKAIIENDNVFVPDGKYSEWEIMKLNYSKSETLPSKLDNFTGSYEVDKDLSEENIEHFFSKKCKHHYGTKGLKMSKVSKNGRCGPNYNNTICPGKECCSRWGWCSGTIGTQSDWCHKKNKSKYRGREGGKYDGDPKFEESDGLEYMCDKNNPICNGYQSKSKRGECITIKESKNERRQKVILPNIDPFVGSIEHFKNTTELLKIGNLPIKKKGNTYLITKDDIKNYKEKKNFINFDGINILENNYGLPRKLDNINDAIYFANQDDNIVGFTENTNNQEYIFKKRGFYPADVRPSIIRKNEIYNTYIKKSYLLNNDKLFRTGDGKSCAVDHGSNDGELAIKNNGIIDESKICPEEKPVCDMKKMTCVIPNNSYRPLLNPAQKERDMIQKEYGFNSPLVGLSSDPEGINMVLKKDNKKSLGGDINNDVKFASFEVLIPIPKGKIYQYKIGVYQTGFSMNTAEKKSFLGVDTENSDLGLGEVYSNILELGEVMENTIIENKPPLLIEPVFKVPKAKRPVIKFFGPTEGDENTIIRVVGLMLDEIEYFCFRDLKVPILKKQSRVIGNVKYQEFLFKAPSVKELNRKCWQSIEKYKALVWGYYHGTQIISSNKEKMFTYVSSGKC